MKKMMVLSMIVLVCIFNHRYIVYASSSLSLYKGASQISVIQLKPHVSSKHYVQKDNMLFINQHTDVDVEIQDIGSRIKQIEILYNTHVLVKKDYPKAIQQCTIPIVDCFREASFNRLDITYIDGYGNRQHASFQIILDQKPAEIISMSYHNKPIQKGDIIKGMHSDLCIKTSDFSTGSGVDFILWYVVDEKGSKSKQYNVKVDQHQEATIRLPLMKGILYVVAMDACHNIKKQGNQYQSIPFHIYRKKQIKAETKIQVTLPKKDVNKVYSTRQLKISYILSNDYHGIQSYTIELYNQNKICTQKLTYHLNQRKYKELDIKKQHNRVTKVSSILHLCASKGKNTLVYTVKSRNGDIKRWKQSLYVDVKTVTYKKEHKYKIPMILIRQAKDELAIHICIHNANITTSNRMIHLRKDGKIIPYNIKKVEKKKNTYILKPKVPQEKEEGYYEVEVLIKDKSNHSTKKQYQFEWKRQHSTFKLVNRFTIEQRNRNPIVKQEIYRNTNGHMQLLSQSDYEVVCLSKKPYVYQYRLHKKYSTQGLTTSFYLKTVDVLGHENYYCISHIKSRNDKKEELINQNNLQDDDKKYWKPIVYALTFIGFVKQIKKVKKKL